MLKSCTPKKMQQDISASIAALWRFINFVLLLLLYCTVLFPVGMGDAEGFHLSETIAPKVGGRSKKKFGV